MAQPAELSRHSADGWTVEDLLDLPEGNKYEILDGCLHVSPMADQEHHWIADELRVALRAACPPGWRAIREIGVSAPGGYFAPDVTVLTPDAPRGGLAIDPAYVALVVEVESRNSRRADRFIKPALYAEAGIEAYWRIERTDQGPVAHLYRRSGSTGYVLEHSVTSGERYTATGPFPVELDPAAWV